MTLQTKLLFGAKPMPDALEGFVFCGAVFGYNFAAPVRPMRWLAWVFGGIGGLFFFQLGVATQLVALAPTILLALYYGLQMPGTRTGFRRVFWLKTLSIGLAWSWVTVLLPALGHLPEKSGMVTLISAGRVAFICALALAYDLFDLEIDRAAGLTTWAVKFGLAQTLAGIHFLLAMSCGFVAINCFSGNYTPFVGLALLGSLLVSALVLHWLATRKRDFYWFKNIVDGLMIGQFLMVLAAG